MKNFVIACLCTLCLLLFFKDCGRQTPKTITRTDTITIVKIDTISHTQVVYRERWHVRTDTIIHQINDTLAVHVPIPIDKYIFTDDSTYSAEVSGYGVALDKMDVFRKTVWQTTTIDRVVISKPKRWGLGVQLGYGIGFDGKPQPYIGVGISCNLVRF